MSGNWLARLRQGLGRTSTELVGAIAAPLTKRRLDETAIAELEEALIAADLGRAVAARVAEGFAHTRFARDATDADVRGALADEIAKILEPVARPLVVDPARKPHVVLVCGVNGSGKTTTIGKLARQMKDDGRAVMIAAGDTFRAA
ncbi:MAG: signal recognition particle receptor subunit alpha, partial [Pseudomonadota bacterium]